MPLFGVDFLQLPRDFPEEVPFVITRCTAEIEHRALGLQVGGILVIDSPHKWPLVARSQARYPSHRRASIGSAGLGCA